MNLMADRSCMKQPTKPDGFHALNRAYILYCTLIFAMLEVKDGQIMQVSYYMNVLQCIVTKGHFPANKGRIKKATNRHIGAI